MEIELLINLGISFFGVLNLIKLKIQNVINLNISPESNPYYLLLIPGTYLFILPYGIYLIIFLLSVICINKSFGIEEIKNFSLKKIWITLKFFSICWIILLIISFVSKLVLGNLREQDIVMEIRANGINIKLIELVFWTVIISPIIEEVFFRSLIYRTLKNYSAHLVAVLISSILFSLVHQNLYSFPLLLALGVSLCIVYEKTNSIIYPIIMHSIFNIIMLNFILIS
jgi:uncharacterized protein